MKESKSFDQVICYTMWYFNFLKSRSQHRKLIFTLPLCVSKVLQTLNLSDTYHEALSWMGSYLKFPSSSFALKKIFIYLHLLGLHELVAH